MGAVHAHKKAAPSIALRATGFHSHCVQTAKRPWSPPFCKRGFFTMGALANFSRAAIACLGMASSVASAAEAESRPAPGKAACLSAADTPDVVKAHKLLEPYAALKSAAQQRKAEALSAKLCISGDDYIYVITLLHRDGKLTHVQMDAGTGKLIARPVHETHEAHEPKDAHEPAKSGPNQ
jgi:hypothetical protein